MKPITLRRPKQHSRSMWPFWRPERNVEWAWVVVVCLALGILIAGVVS